LVYHFALFNSSKPAFFVHEDEDVPLAIPTPQKSVLSSKVLSVIKPAEEHHVALALFEPPDPMKKPMYCKHLVYQVSFALRVLIFSNETSLHVGTSYIFRV